MADLDYDFRTLRRQLGLTQAKMAERLRISRPYYGDLESGKKRPSEALAELARLVEKDATLPSRGNVKELGGKYGTVPTASAPRTPVIADPHQFPTDARVAAALEELEEDFEKLRDVVREDPEKVTIVRWLLRKHLKPEDLLE